MSIELYNLPEPKIIVKRQINDIVPNVRCYEIEKVATGETKIVPSVTTCIDDGNTFGIDEWRNELGHQYADFVTEFSQYLGDRYHRSLEWYFKGYLSPEEEETHIARHCIKNIKQLIGAELRVASWEYDFAGTLDLAYLNQESRLVMTDNKSHHRAYGKMDEDNDYDHSLDRSVQSSKLSKYRKQLAPYGVALLETYGLSFTHELSEVWLFNTNTFCMESITVHGKSKRATVEKSWLSFRKSQAKFFEWAESEPQLAEALGLVEPESRLQLESRDLSALPF